MSALLYLILVTLCIHEAKSLQATFMGDGYLFYNISKSNALDYRHEVVTVQFKTTDKNGLLFYTGNGEHFINMGLANGSVYISTLVSMAEGIIFQYPAGKTTSQNDGQWHKVSVTRNIQQLNDTTAKLSMSAQVDEAAASKWSTQVEFTKFISRVLYLGGVANFHAIAGTKATKNWRGCLRNVSTQTDTVTLDLLDIDQNEGNKLLASIGSIKYGKCEEVLSLPPISLRTRAGYITLPIHKRSDRTIMSFNFNTFVPAGLILYITGQRQRAFALELLDGYLEMVVEKRGNTERTKCVDKRVNDGQMHSVSLSLELDRVVAMTDGTHKSLTFGGDGRPFSLGSTLYLAGLDYSMASHKVHPLIYTAAMRQGYVGCLEHLMLDGVVQDIHSIAAEQKVDSVKGCLANQSSSCVDSACIRHEQGLTAKFNGSQYLIGNTPDITRASGAETITIRFKTAHFYGTILRTANQLNSSSVEVFLYGGKLFLRYNILNEIQIMNVADGLCDNQWHVLLISRINAQVKVQVDKQTPLIETLLYNRSGHWTLVVRTVTLGSYAPKRIQRANVVPTIDDLSTIPGFIGYMQTVELNGVSYLPQLSEGKVAIRLDYTCEFSTNSLTPSAVVSVRGEPVPVGLPPSKPLSTLTMYFKSRQDSALIFYSESASQMVGMELVEGFVHFYVWSKTNCREIKSKSNTFGDGKWHMVSMATRTRDRRTLILMDTERNEIPTREVNIDEIVFAGKNGSYGDLPSCMAAVSGLHGCVGSLEINGMRINMMESTVAKTSSISADCPVLRPVNCSSDYCQNGGECIQVDDFYIKCQCLLTTFTGATCSDEPVTYRFGTEGASVSGSIEYRIADARDTRNDELAFRVNTNSFNGNLIKVVSDKFSNDKLMVTIWNKKVYVRYNIGGSDHHAIGPVISDGHDHFVRFSRVGPKGYLYVDGNKYETRDTDRLVQNEDEVLKVFNAQSIIRIGGLSFVGDIKGLSLNGEEIFSGDDTLTLIGNVWRVGSRLPAGTTDALVVTSVPQETLCDTQCKTATSVDDIITLTTWPKSNSKPIPSLPSTFTSSNKVTSSTISVRKRPNVTFQSSDGGNDKFFDMTENLPILAGISGAALFTIMLIAIIACKLTRNRQSPKMSEKEGNEKSHTKGQSPAYAGELQGDMNSSYSNGQPQTISKEWYV